MKLLKAGAVAAALCAAPAAYATTLNQPVAENAYITVGALDWAWAAPCAPSSPTCGAIDLSFQSQFGWRLPTLQEFRDAAITAMSFVFDGANAPVSGSPGVNGGVIRGGAPGDTACAAIYFSTVHNHCDYGDGNTGRWHILDSGLSSETLVVRANGVTPPPSGVPVPAGLPLALTGLGALAWLRRKAKRS